MTAQRGDRFVDDFLEGRFTIDGATITRPEAQEPAARQ